jgi:hypothetical protein
VVEQVKQLNMDMVVWLDFNTSCSALFYSILFLQYARLYKIMQITFRVRA